MLLSSTRSPVFLVSTTQWLPMVYNKKRVIIVALIFASAWAWMASLYFTITFHNQKRPSKLQNAPTWANTTPIVIMAPVKNQTEINDTDDSDIDETLHQLINFKDLGRNKRAVLLLIIVSTAPARFKRRQLIRKTWWKHCSGNQAQVGRQDKFLIACYLTISRILYFQLFIAKFSTDNDDYNKQKSTGLNKLAKQQLCTYITPCFCTFFIVVQQPRREKPNLTFYTEDVNKRHRFWTCIQSFWNKPSEKFAKIWQLNEVQ